MTIIESTTSNALEASIRARLALDSQARSVAQDLDGTLVKLNVENRPLYILFQDGTVKVASYTDEVPQLTITGTVVAVGSTLLSGRATDVELDGDETKLELLKHIFRPSFNVNSMADTLRATAEYGVAATKSAIEGLASELTTNRRDQARIEELELQLQELQKAFNSLEDYVKTLGKP